MKPTSPLAKAQIARLSELQRMGVCTDESLSEFLREHEQPCSAETLKKYRQGRRTAPLALLDFLLKHATPAERIAILELWARPFGLKVVPELAPAIQLRLVETAGLASRIRDELEQLAGPVPLARRAA